MGQGRLLALGSSSRLKARHGEGFQIILKLQFITPEDADYLAWKERVQEVVSANEELSERLAGNGWKADLSTVRYIVKELDLGMDADERIVTAEDGGVGEEALIAAQAMFGGAALSELLYYIVLTARIGDVEKFMEAREAEWGMCERTERKQLSLKYQVQGGGKGGGEGGGVGIGRLFEVLEQAKDDLKLIDYSASMMTLEDVFQKFAVEEK
jgi:hypothetical protein